MQWIQPVQTPKAHNLPIVLPLADYGSSFGSNFQKPLQYPNLHLQVQSKRYLLQYISKLESYYK
jgi:hypothetical protein